jgi:hypothetical protein
MNAESKKRYKNIDFPFICPITNREFNSFKRIILLCDKNFKSRT